MDKNKIIEEAKRIEEDSLYSSKSHFEAAKFWNNISIASGVFIAIMSACAGSLAFAEFTYSNIISGILSMLVATLTGIVTFTKPNKKSSTHKEAGNSYGALKNNVRIFYNNEIELISDEQSLEKLKMFSDLRNELNSSSEQVPTWSFKSARKGIEEGEAKYVVDKK